MPVLERLRKAGFSVWPFDRARFPLVVEIWPRIFMGNLDKSSRDERRRYLATQYPGLEERAQFAAEESDDAFDALVSAMEMNRLGESFGALTNDRDSTRLLEGEIWRPSLKGV
jgi:hypothetical protein